MPNYRVQYIDPSLAFNGDRFNGDYDEAWITLREDDDPVQLLEDLIEDLNDDFAEHNPRGRTCDDITPTAFYWRLIKNV